MDILISADITLLMEVQLPPITPNRSVCLTDFSLGWLLIDFLKNVYTFIRAASASCWLAAGLS